MRVLAVLTDAGQRALAGRRGGGGVRAGGRRECLRVPWWCRRDPPGRVLAGRSSAR